LFHAIRESERELSDTRRTRYSPRLPVECLHSTLAGPNSRGTGGEGLGEVVATRKNFFLAGCDEVVPGIEGFLGVVTSIAVDKSRFVSSCVQDDLSNSNTLAGLGPAEGLRYITFEKLLDSFLRLRAEIPVDASIVISGSLETVSVCRGDSIGFSFLDESESRPTGRDSS